MKRACVAKKVDSDLSCFEDINYQFKTVLYDVVCSLRLYKKNQKQTGLNKLCSLEIESSRVLN